MAEKWDPIGYLREKYGYADPVDEWGDEALEEVLDDDPMALSVPVIAERVGRWERDKKALYMARRALAQILMDIIERDCANLCCDNERDLHWLCGRLAKRLTRVCDHEWTEIAPETTHDDDRNNSMWFWCIRCGVLRLGGAAGEIFRPGPHQRKAVTSEVAPSPRVPDAG